MVFYGMCMMLRKLPGDLSTENKVVFVYLVITRLSRYNEIQDLVITRVCRCNEIPGSRYNEIWEVVVTRS